MASFGLVTEGPTDQLIISDILAGVFNSRDLDVRPLQPIRDETDKNRKENYGGWTRVLEYCKSDRFKQAFAAIDYMIIQIDTDKHQDAGFDVPYVGDETVEDLVQRVRTRIVQLINEPFFSTYQDRIIFGIAVDVTECWLLPIYYSNNKKSKITGCVTGLNPELNRRFGFTIDVQKKKVDLYWKISEAYQDQTEIMRVYRHNPSLRIFVDDMIARNIVV